MKKIIVLLLSVVLLAELCACKGGVKENEKPQASEKAPTVQSEEKNDENMYRYFFTTEISSGKNPINIEAGVIEEYSAVLSPKDSPEALAMGDKFSEEIRNNIIADFEKPGDRMCHVSTFVYAKGNIYMSYYANTDTGAEDPNFQVARLAYCPEKDTSKMTYLDIQKVGDKACNRIIDRVYDTILMTKEDEPDNLYILWTASVDKKYYRFYRIFNMETEELSETFVNRFKVGNTVNDFSTTGIQSALTENGIGYKTMFSDIGIMQKLSYRIENGEKWYYSGTYSGDFNCIIKSKDLMTWEYVSQPDFINQSKWENAVYVLNDKVYYFVRQHDPHFDEDGKLKDGSIYGFLTYYDLKTGKWETPVLVEDCQSRSDFIVYGGNLYLFHAPINRNHIGLLKINTDDLSKTEIVFAADMKGSCFYPFISYNSKGELSMSYTVSRKHIRLAEFTLSKYL